VASKAIMHEIASILAQPALTAVHWIMLQKGEQKGQGKEQEAGERISRQGAEPKYHG
jgi:hypothetical protein